MDWARQDSINFIMTPMIYIILKRLLVGLRNAMADEPDAKLSLLIGKKPPEMLLAVGANV